MDTNLNNNIDEEKDYEENEKIEVKEDESLYIKEKTDNEKLKKKNIFMSSAFIILIVLLFAVVSVGSYAPMKNNILSTKDHTKAYIESNDFVYTLTRLTSYLKQGKLDGEWYESRYDNLENIKYYMSNIDKTRSISNIEDVTENEIQDQISNSQFYVHLKTDENGNATIESSLGNKFNDRFIDGLDLRDDDHKGEYANLDILYIVPKNLDNDNDLFINNIKEFHIVPYMILILSIGAVSIIILSVVAFCIPYASQRRMGISRVFNKMFLELKLFIILGFIGFVGIGGVAIYQEFNFSFQEPFSPINMIYDANPYFYMIGIPVTFILYLLIYLSIVYMKHIYHTGFKEGFIKNSIFGKVCFSILRKIKRLFRAMLEIDITKDSHKRMVMILGINLMALWMIALTGGLGFILAIAYTLFLFKYLLKVMNKVKALNDGSSKLAEGNFDITLDENIGILSPISKNLNNIKDGFKVAIDKEIKSQQMKTELISNVSHDLKTPLTSIITYVDLLKSEDITNEKQKEYIDILDRKSKRLKILIEDLFEASKASSGNVDLHLEKVDVVALFRQTLGELEEKINHSTLQFKMNIPENKVICKLDGRRTFRVFENIMSNILKYAMPHSRVYIDVVEDKNEVSFTFKNIAAYEMNFDAAEITERFTRGDKSRNTEGSGLGLAIAKSLIELQNGKLTITIDGDLFKLIVSFPKVESI